MTDAPTRLPRISVVTPSYNQAAYVGQVIRSVLDQAYPDLEYFVMDGGSTDGSADVIRSYADRLTGWVSERDGGQSAAINKGFARCTGEVMCWLNSDDLHEPDTLAFVGRYFVDHPSIDMVCGGVRSVDSNGTTLEHLPAQFSGLTELVRYWVGYHIHQPSVFWRRSVYHRLGGLNETLNLSMDFDYWLRAAAAGFRIATVDRILSSATMHDAQKTAGGFGKYRKSQLKDVIRLFGSPFSLKYWNARSTLYSHLVRTAVRRGLGRPTCYE